MHKNQTVAGYWLTSRLAADSQSVAEVVADLLKLADAGQLRGVVKHAFALEDAADAHRAISDRRTVGKVVLTI